MKKQRLLALLLCVLMSLGLLASCTGNTPPPSDAPSTAPTDAVTPTPQDSDETEDDPYSFYPIEGTPTLSYWMPLAEPQLAALRLDYNDYPVRVEMEKRTGVHIEWTLPAFGVYIEQFNLMIASESYTDMIHRQMYSPGLDQAVKDGIYLRLNDIMDEYAPNYMAMLAEREESWKGSITDDGNRVGFQQLYEWMGKSNPPAGGLAWRRDIARQLGWSSQPTSVAELNEYLDDALAAGYKNFFVPPRYGFQNDASSGHIPAFFDSATRMLNVDGKVTYGPTMPGFKDYVAQMKDWYEKGILDQDFMMERDLSRTAGMWADESFIIGTAGNTSVGTTYLDQGITDIADFYIEAIAPIKTHNGDAPKHGSKVPDVSSVYTVITTACEIPEVAVRWLDYFFTEEGALLANYGVEGETFEWGEGDSGFWRWGGNPQYNDFITDNPDKVGTVIAIMTFCWTVGPVYRPWLPETLDLEINQQIWAEGTENYVWNMPELITVGSDDASKYAAILVDAETFCQETVAKLITGALSMDEYESYFIAQLNEMNVDEMVAIQQAALDRYLAR